MKNNRNNHREVVSDVLMVAGGTAVSVGVGMLHAAAGIIVGGILAMVFGWLIARGGDAE